MNAEEQTERFQMRVAPSFMSAIDDWRRKQPDLPSRAEAIRRLVELSLTVPRTIRVIDATGDAKAARGKPKKR